MPYMKLSLSIFLYVFLLDMAWLGFIAKDLYDKEIGMLIRKSGANMSPNWYAAILVYVAIVAGIMIFVLPKAGDNYTSALLYGALFGLVTYGIYDFTNLAVLANWTYKITFIDLLWGTFLCSATTIFGVWMQRFISS